MSGFNFVLFHPGRFEHSLNIPCLGLIMQSNVMYTSLQVSPFGPHQTMFVLLNLNVPSLGTIMQLLALLNFNFPSLGTIMHLFSLLTFK